MAITLMFGLPGAGKTSVCSQIAVDESYRIKMGKSRYTSIITNAPISCEGVYKSDDFSWLGDYYVPGALILIDEATLLWDSRNYKAFAKNLVKAFVLHRHTKNDVIVFVQIWNRLDKTIRDICDKVYYLHKGALAKNVTYCNLIPYHILFPESGDSAGDIVMGYKKCSFFRRAISKRLYRPLYYKYFDSFWIPDDMIELNVETFDAFWIHSTVNGMPTDNMDRFLKLIDRICRSSEEDHEDEDSD